MPDAVNMVTGNHTESAINPTADSVCDGDSTMANGIHAVAGIGPITFNTGIPQYRAWANQPIQTPVINALTTPTVYPPKSRISECHVLSNRTTRSLMRLCRTPAGFGN